LLIWRDQSTGYAILSTSSYTRNHHNSVAVKEAYDRAARPGQVLEVSDGVGVYVDPIDAAGPGLHVADSGLRD
jgi:hypothetical protein